MTGAVHGFWTGRWSTGREREARAAALRAVPAEFDGWRSQELQLDARTERVAGIDGYLMRRYERGNAVVTALVVCGPPGPVAVHTPEVCYEGTGYVTAPPKETLTLPAEGGHSADTFWVADYAKEVSPLPRFLRVIYGMSSDGTWKATSTPRVDFAGVPVLCKIYVVRETTSGDEPVKGDPGAEFLAAFVPVLKRSVFGGR
jgi:hypothetical protein